MRRQEAERTRVEAYEASLRRVSQQTRPTPDFHNAVNDVMRGFEARVLRDAQAWRPQMKTRDAARLRLAAARYLFARYPVAAHREQIWMDCHGVSMNVPLSFTVVRQNGRFQPIALRGLVGRNRMF